MRSRFLVLIFGASVALPLACKKEETPPPQQPQPYPYQPAPAPAPAPAPVATQPGPAPTGAQPAPTAAAAGTLATPSPMALPCTSDAACLTHKCNMQFGKCAWPCVSETDCNPGNQCMAGACVPKMQ
jgi:hypothetical protein